MFNFYYDKEKETMFVYIPITVKTLMYLKSKYKHVMVVGKKDKKRL